jgi:hypothetical protein
MAKSVNLKRIEKIETKLTPKELAIRLADQLRKHSTIKDFISAFSSSSSIEDIPIDKPYHLLHKQVENLYKSNTPEDIKTKIRLSQELRSEYGVLRTLILDFNEIIAQRNDTWSIKISLVFNMLLVMIYEVVTRWVPWKKNDGDNSCGVSFMIDPWISATKNMFIEIFLFQSAVNKIQEKYFDGHPFLAQGEDARLTKNIKQVEIIIKLFNSHLKVAKDRGYSDKMSINIKMIKESLIRTQFSDIFVESFIKAAKDKTNLDILVETGDKSELKRYLWNLVKER